MGLYFLCFSVFGVFDFGILNIDVEWILLRGGLRGFVSLSGRRFTIFGEVIMMMEVIITMEVIMLK